MKKLAAVFLAFTLVFSSVGTTIFFGGDHQVEAKSYKSGKKGFNSQDSNKSNIQKDNKDNNNATTNQNNTNKSNNDTAQTKKGGFTSGGLMKGLFIGGLAGLLFGSLFGDLGILGSILGFMVNAAAIMVIVFLCVKIYQVMTRKKKAETTKTWNN
ncbi:hypothetical protein [Metasolibacillus meyeri]|uniref:hypothetical protein n=1 Tax=Metasolibacillus meyeri TaxID=1071052 RepID=UPI000D31A127|nr:hypothetical protein [Metasolibacillus meyeri]